MNGGFASESINGYLFNEGVSEAINGYLKTFDNVAEIYGFVQTGTATETGVINGFILTADAEDQINGFLLVNESGPRGYIRGSIDGQFIDGYLFNTGGNSSINAWLNVDLSNEIHGYMRSALFESGSINSYMNAHGASDIDGYIAGISGFETSNINSFIIGVANPNEAINSYLISNPGDICDSHGNVLLPALPSYTLPSSIFFG